MKYFETLLQYGCFSFSEAAHMVGNHSTTASMLNYYIKHGAIIQIRKGLYSAINPLDKEPVANKYLIGTKLTECAVISHHSAFEYYGYTNQVSYQVFVSSHSKFNTFDFNGYTYIHIPTNMSIGIETTSLGIRVTDIERTVLDSINDFEKEMGFEELIQCITIIPYLDEQKILSYLEIYNKNFLYQKVGFIFEHFRDNFGFSDDFFNICKKNIKKSSRYLFNYNTNGEMAFSYQWHLTYPKKLWDAISGGRIYAEI